MDKRTLSILSFLLALVLVGQGCAKQAQQNTPGAADKGKNKQEMAQEKENQGSEVSEKAQELKDTSKEDIEQKVEEIKQQAREIEDKKKGSKEDEEDSGGQEDAGEQEETASGPGPKVVDISGTEYDFSPSEIQVEKGQEVTVNFTNEGDVGHDLVIPELDRGTSVISSGETESFSFTAPKSGTLNLDFECSVPGHAKAGMVGEVDVE